MNKLKRLPISLVFAIMTILAFTFVSYDWIMNVPGRMFFIIIAGGLGFLLEIMNAELKFWKYKP